MKLPAYITDYRVTPVSPTEELLALGRLLSDIGYYASTALDSEHQSLALTCLAMLADVMAELRRRGAVENEQDLFAGEESESHACHDALSRCSVAELEMHYRRLRFMPCAQLEVVRELEKRHPGSLLEQIMKDYCLMTFRNELDYASFLNNASIGDPAAPALVPVTIPTDITFL